MAVTGQGPGGAGSSTERNERWRPRGHVKPTGRGCRASGRHHRTSEPEGLRESLWTSCPLVDAFRVCKRPSLKIHSQTTAGSHVGKSAQTQRLNHGAACCRGGKEARVKKRSFVRFGAIRQSLGGGENVSVEK